MSAPQETSTAPQQSSALRTGFSAGTALLGGLALGVALAIVLGMTSTAIYFSRMFSGSMQGVHAAHSSGIWGAVITLVTSPPLLIGTLLVFIIPAYVIAGLHIGRARAAGRLIARYGDGLAQRLTDLLAERIEALPKAHGALHRSADLVSADAALQHLQPWIGNGRVVRFLVRAVLGRLPLAELLQEWNATRGELGAEARKGDPALRALIFGKVRGILEGLGDVPWWVLWAVMVLNAAVFAVGLWLLP